MTRSAYSVRVPLVACPFCREMFEEGEAKTCPLCGVALTSFDKLPPSHDARALADDEDIPNAPEYEPFPITYLGRHRGVLMALSLVGFALFFLPWLDVTLPDVVALTGFDLAHRMGWSWGAGVAWVVLLPTVMSRRNIVQMRGARVAAAFLSAVPALTVAILLAKPPHGGIVPIRFTYDWALYATLATSVLALYYSTRLGGRIDDIQVTRGTSEGQHLH